MHPFWILAQTFTKKYHELLVHYRLQLNWNDFFICRLNQVKCPVDSLPYLGANLISFRAISSRQNNYKLRSSVSIFHKFIILKHAVEAFNGCAYFPFNLCEFCGHYFAILFIDLVPDCIRNTNIICSTIIISFSLFA